MFGRLIRKLRDFKKIVSVRQIYLLKCRLTGLLEKVGGLKALSRDTVSIAMEMG